MKLPFALSLTLAVASAGFACSSSGSSASPGGSDASSPDDAGNNPPNTGNDANDNSATDSSTNSATDSSDDATDSSSSVVDAGPLSFATDIYAPIIEVHCVGCHGFEADGGPASGVSFGKLDMHSVDAGYANLVNVAAAGGSCAEIDGSAGPIRVVPGSASRSLLWDKVSGYLDPPVLCGSAMPKSGEIPDGGQAFVAAQIQTWINQGALP